jgi:hypothetical protein
MTSHVSPADDLLDRAVTAVRDRGAPDRPPAALLDRTVAAVDAAARAPRPWLATRLGRPLAAIAAAAALATAAAVMVAIVPPPGGGSAFAAMLDKVREMKSVRYRVTAHDVVNAGPADAISFIVIETPDGARIESEIGPRVTIFGPKHSVILDTQAKKLLMLPAAEDGPPLAVRPDLLAQFRDADGGLGEPIEGKQVGPVATRGYRVKKKRSGEGDAGVRSMRVYVDPATELPVYVEEDENAREGRLQTMIVLSDFEWGIEVDPQLLSLDPPPGYRHEKLDVPPRAPTSPPEAIAAGLRFYADRKNGSLPDTLEGFEATGALEQTVDERQKKAMVADVPTMLTRVQEVFGPWLGLMGALDGLEKQKIQIHYLGKGLKAGNGSTLVAWWKAEQPGRAIAIYDDFSVKEIDEPAAAE